MRRSHTVRIIGGVVFLLLVLSGVDLVRKYFADTVDEQFRAVHGDLAPRFGEGELAPDFTLPDNSGQTHSLTSLVKRDTVLCFLCGCAQCQHMQLYMNELWKKMGDQAPAVVAVTTASPDGEAAWRRDTGLRQTMLYAPKSTEGGAIGVVETYRGHPCPRLYRLSSDRRVTWIGPSLYQVSRAQDLGTALLRELRRTGTIPKDVPDPESALPHPSH